MKFINATALAVRSIFVVISLAASGCASTHYTNLKPSEFTKTSDPKFYTIERTVTSQKKAEAIGAVDSTQGILPGTYTSALENQDGTLFFGNGRSYFVKYANRNQYYLRAGGFWIPKANGASPQLFYIVDSSEIITAASVEEAIRGSTAAEKSPYAGLIPVLVPTEMGFAERLSAELKPVKLRKTEIAR